MFLKWLLAWYHGGAAAMEILKRWQLWFLYKVVGSILYIYDGLKHGKLC